MKKSISSLVLNTALASLFVVSAVGCSDKVDSVGLPVASTTVGTEIDDSVITSSVKSALLADADIKSFDFKVETRKGEVLLSGYVDSQAQPPWARRLTLASSPARSRQHCWLTLISKASILQWSPATMRFC